LYNFAVSYFQPVTITIYFSPTAVQDYSGSGEVDSDAFNPVIPLSFDGSGVAFEVTPANIAFGIETIGTATPQSLCTITNLESSSSIVVNSINFTGPFSIGSTSPSLPVTIAANGTLQFGVVFTPVAPGAATGSVNVVSTISGTVGVRLTGSAYPPFVVGYQLPFFAATSGNVASVALPLTDVELAGGVSNGGLSGGLALLVLPVQNITNGSYGLAYQDFNDLAADAKDFTVSFPVEDTPEYRPLTVKKIVLILANVGTNAITYTLTGSLRGKYVSLTGVLNIANVSSAGNNLVQAEVDVIFTANLIQLSLSGLPNAVAYKIIKSKLVCTYSTDDLI
jgi:hypothetical protein